MLEKILKDLDDCNKCLLSLKASGEPMYNSLISFWAKRRDELKNELRKVVDFRNTINQFEGVQ